MGNTTANESISKYFKQKGTSAVHAALTIAQGYAESANANPRAIPILFQEMLAVLTTGELPAPAAPKTQGQTGY